MEVKFPCCPILGDDSRGNARKTGIAADSTGMAAYRISNLMEAIMEVIIWYPEGAFAFSLTGG